MKTLLVRFLGLLLLFLLSPKTTAQVMPFGIFHTAQAVQIVGKDNTTLVVEVTTATGRIWMDRNLGATRAAISSTDGPAYGDLYQWGRGFDGHQIRNSSIIDVLSTTDSPGNANFIENIAATPFDWRNPQNDNLWQGVDGINNPCPNGFRLPTEQEWIAERATWSSANTAGAFSSQLKLTMAGYRGNNGLLSNVNTRGFYFSSTVSGTSMRYIRFNTTVAEMLTAARSSGFTIRCIKD